MIRFNLRAGEAWRKPFGNAAVLRTLARFEQPDGSGMAGKKTAMTQKGSKTSARAAAGKRWSQRVTEESDALDLEPGVFTHENPKDIAASLKRSAVRSKRRKSDPYRSAMSMLTFYINRAGKGLSTAQVKVLNQAKDELRALFGRN
jgi:hypothetical protein